MRILKIKKQWFLFLTIGIFLFFTACSQALPSSASTNVEISPTSTVTPLVAGLKPDLVAPITEPAVPLPSKSAEETLPVEAVLDPAQWMTWPEVPVVTQHAREIYLLGQSLGNDPHSFSIFGDCQSLPEVFLGPYETDPAKFSSLSLNLQETVKFFEDSLIRNSPTSKTGTTSGALLWPEWHENKYGCTGNESPMDCELRTHNPSFVLIMVGTHWEGARNEYYMRKILEALLERGIVPILSTKADNREGDYSINLQMAKLAVEYDIPLWNFWPVTAELPNRGLYTKEVDRRLGDIYLTETALELHRYSALQVLDMVRRAVSGN